MSGAIDDDTRRTIAGGRETLGEMLRAAQVHLQKVFIVFVIGFLGTFWALRGFVWDKLRRDLLNSQAKVVFVTPFDVILLQVKIGLIVGVIIAVPVLLYYSRDALRSRGILPDAPIARWKMAAIALGVVGLFALGVAYAYVLFFPIMFKFLANTAVNSGFRPTYSIVKWVEFVALLSLSFGIAAQLPLVMSLLAYTEIVPYETFRDRWKHAVLGLYAAGALFTPPDPITQIMWATPLVALYAFSLKFTRIVVTLRRSSEQLDITAVVRQRANVIAGTAVLAGLAVYLFFTNGGLSLVNDATARLPGTFWPRLSPLGAILGLDQTVAAALVGVVAALLIGAFVLYRYVSRELDELGLTGPAPSSSGDPSEIDVGELTVDGVRAAPPEAFTDMSENEALQLASDAMEEDDPDRAQAILDKWDEAQDIAQIESETFETAGQRDDPAPPEPPADNPGPPVEGESELPSETVRPEDGDPAAGMPEEADRGGRAPDPTGDSSEEGSGNVFTETTTGVVDAFTEDETTEEDIGGYYTDIAFILESLTSRAFRIVGLFMGVLAIVFVWLYKGGIRDIQNDFLARLPPNMNPADVTPVALHPVEHLIFEIKFSALVAVVVTLPLLIYYAWPALRERGLVTGDRRVLVLWAGTLIGGVTIGSIVGYTQVAPAVISWLAQDALGAHMVIAYRIKYYGWLIVYTTVGIGLLAEIPVTLFLFHYGGLVSFTTVWGRWREIIVGIFAFAALVSPKGMFTMLVLAIPISLSFLLGLSALWVLTLGGRKATDESEPAD